MIELFLFVVNDKLGFHNAVGRFNPGVLMFPVEDTRHLTWEKCKFNIDRFIWKSDVVNDLSLLVTEVRYVVARLKDNSTKQHNKKC